MGLLDMFSPQPSSSGGLLGNMDDPREAAQMSMIMGLLEAGGSSTKPTSFGQAAAHAYGRGMQAYQQGQQLQHENTANQLQNAQLAQALRQGDITQSVYQKILDRMKTPNAMSQEDFSSGQTALGQGAAAGDIGPTLTNMGRMPPPMPSTPSTSDGGMFGLNDNGMLGGMLAGPGELGKAIVAANAPTDFTKLLQQSGIDPNSTIGKQLMQQQISKQNNIPLVAGRAGAPMYNPDGTIAAMAPKIPNNAIPQIVNGRVVGVSALPGAAGVEQINSYASAAGKNQAEPITAYSGTQPVFTNKLTAAQGFPTVTPQQQTQANNERLSILQQELSNEQDPSNRVALQREIARTQAQQQSGNPFSSSALTPGLAPGLAESQTALATTGAKRYNDTLSLAADSPTRVNVYDNILNLSREGANTGPGEAWKNKVKGYVANTPILGSVTGSWKDDVTGFQELNKFLYQNAQRNWQAAGGTGTDAQLEAFTHANPNDAMFPQALQTMAQWGKAGELALQAKTNAMQQWKDAQGGNVANQDQFERTWRNNFDPILFQLKTMAPDQASAYVAKLKQSSPNVYQNLMMKAGALKNIGGL